MTSYHFNLLGNNFTTDNYGIICNDYFNMGINIYQDWKRIGLLSDMFYYRGINMPGCDLHVEFPELYNCRYYEIGKNIQFKSYEHNLGFSGSHGGGYRPEKLIVYFEVLRGWLLDPIIYKYVVIVDALDTHTVYGELYKNDKLITRSRPIKCGDLGYD